MFSTRMIISRDQGKGFAQKYYKTTPVDTDTAPKLQRQSAFAEVLARFSTIWHRHGHS